MSVLDELVIGVMRIIVPWRVGHVIFQSVPRTLKRGFIHISMLSFVRSSYAAHGMFVGGRHKMLSLGEQAKLLMDFMRLRANPEKNRAF